MRQGWIVADPGTDNAGMNAPTPQDPKQDRQADQDLLFKGLVITLIGAGILLGALYARSPSVQELLASSRLVGWFALVLGLALLGRYYLRRRRSGSSEPRG